jgi:di/tricarboxylate transporter
MYTPLKKMYVTMRDNIPNIEISWLEMINQQGPTVAILGLILFVLWKAYKKTDERIFKFLESNQKVIVDNTTAMNSLTKAVDRMGISNLK